MLQYGPGIREQEVTMLRSRITDSFKVVDEDGINHSVQEITSFPESDEAHAEPSVHYQLEDGRRLKARLAAREFEDEGTGAIYDRA
jgi:hypothetical protein